MCFIDKIGLNMENLYVPTKQITIAELQSLCSKYDELELINIEHHQVNKSTEMNKEGFQNVKNEKVFLIQSSFKKDLAPPYTVFKNPKRNFVIVDSIKDPTKENEYYVNSFSFDGDDPHHIIKLVQYETSVLVHNEQAVSDYLKYEHFGTADLNEVGERIWSEMDDDEKEPFQIKLTPEQHEAWWIVYGRWLEEEIDLLEKALNLSNDFKRKKMKQLWFEYEQTSKTKFLNKLKAA